MATLSQSIALGRRWAGANSSSLVDAAAIDFANEALLEYRRELIKGGVKAGQTQESYMTPLAGVAQYNYNTNPQQWLLWAIEVNYNNTSQNNYVPAKKASAANTPAQTSFDWLRVNQSIMIPLYDDSGQFFEVFPTAQANFNLVNAFRMIFIVQPTPYATTGDTLAWPEALDYSILSARIAANQLRAIFKFAEADKFDALFMNKIKGQVGLLAQGGQQPTTPQSIPWTGAEF